MYYKLVCAFTFFFNVTFLSAQSVTEWQVNIDFEANKTELSLESKKKLDVFSQNIKQYPDYALRIDNFCPENQDKTSLPRLNTLKNYLLSQGFMPEKIEISEEKPEKVVENHFSIKAYCYRENRAFLYAESKTTRPLSIDALFKQLQRESEYFIIDNDRDTFIMCKKGTMIMFSAGSFNLPRGSKVKVKAKEVLSTTDMLLENLTTTAQNRLLNSGGMLKVEAFTLDEKALKLKEGRSIAVRVPTQNYEPQMQYFSGAQNGNVVDWNLMQTAPIRNNRLVFGSALLLKSQYYDPVQDYAMVEYLTEEKYNPSKYYPHFGQSTDNYFKTFLSLITQDTCKDLYYPIDITRIDTFKRVETEKSVGSFIKKVLTGTPQTTVSTVTKDVFFTRYEINSGLSGACLELARFGKLRHMERLSWYDIHRAKHAKEYELLEHSLKVRGYDNIMAALPKRIAEYDERIKEFRQMTIDEFGYMDSINDKRLLEWEAKYKKWLQIQEKEAAERLSKGNIQNSDINYYFFESNNLGFLNCDYFVNNTDPVVVQTDLKKASNLDVKLVFQDRMSAMNVNSEGENIAFKNVPKGRKAWLIAMDFYNTGARLAIQEIETGQKIPNLDFKQMSLQDIKAKLATINPSSF